MGIRHRLFHNALGGLGTNLKRLRELGFKPLVAGLAAALIVGGVAAGLIHLLASVLVKAA